MLSTLGEPVAGGDDADDDQDQQGDDQAEVAPDRAVHDAGRTSSRCRRPRGCCLDPALLVRGSGDRRRRVSAARSCRTSFHDQVEHPVLVDVCGRALVDDRALADHQHAVGQAEHLLDLAGHHHHGDAVVGQPADQARRSRCGRRRRRRGSARRAAAPGSRAAASGPARPSAGCRRTACAHRARRRSGGRRATSACSSPRRARRRGAGSRTGRSGSRRGEGDVARHRLVEQQRLALALLRGQPDARRRPPRRRSRCAAACRRR